MLTSVFRISEVEALSVMLTAHAEGARVVAVYTKDIAETKAFEATDVGRNEGHPLLFTTEPER